jgi:hypothetical protein
MERFWTTEEIEEEVNKVSGTWVKRRNLREKLKAENNKILDNTIMVLKSNIRVLKSHGATQSYLRTYYSKLTEWECKRL